jgi:hypothetical protein
MRLLSGLVLLYFTGWATTPDAWSRAAQRFVPDVKWRSNSVIAADFTCSGHQETAILGTNSTEIVVAVFLHGPRRNPEVLRYSAKVRDAKLARLETDTLDYEKNPMGIDLPGFQRSTVCKGIRLTDDQIDSAHIYWNHLAKRFDDWSL